MLTWGCGSGQGFQFFAPMPADRITGVLAELCRTAGARVIPLRAEGA